jgi:hypothetical protein
MEQQGLPTNIVILFLGVLLFTMALIGLITALVFTA